MKRNEAISILKRCEKHLKNFEIKSLSIFGLIARDEAHPEIDIDILVEFSELPTFDRYMDLKFYLEDCLGQTVDLVSQKRFKPQIRQSVENEAILVAEPSALYKMGGSNDNEGLAIAFCQPTKSHSLG